MILEAEKESTLRHEKKKMASNIYDLIDVHLPISWLLIDALLRSKNGEREAFVWHKF